MLTGRGGAASAAAQRAQKAPGRLHSRPYSSRCSEAEHAWGRFGRSLRVRALALLLKRLGHSPNKGPGARGRTALPVPLCRVLSRARARRPRWVGHGRAPGPLVGAAVRQLERGALEPASKARGLHGGRVVAHERTHEQRRRRRDEERGAPRRARGRARHAGAELGRGGGKAQQDRKRRAPAGTRFPRWRWRHGCPSRSHAPAGQAALSRSRVQRVVLRLCRGRAAGWPTARRRARGAACSRHDAQAHAPPRSRCQDAK